MRIYWSILFLLGCLCLQAQNGSFHVSDGGVYVQGDVFITMQDVDVQNNGEVQADSLSNFYFAGQTPITIDGNQPRFGNIFLDTDMDLLTGIATQDITLQQGVLEMNDNDITLGGNIWEERNESYIFSNSTGEIIKTLDLEPGQSYNPGNMGFQFRTPDFAIEDFELRRGHEPQEFNNLSSVSRYYKSNNEFKFGDVAFQYLDHEYIGSNERFQQLFYQNFSDKVWEESTFILTDTIQNISEANLSQDGYFFTLFENVVSDFVLIPQILTLNNDGINDVLRITGLAKYPNNKILIFNRWGDIVFEEQPYQNKWDGRSATATFFNSKGILPVGTYYILFQPDVNKEQVIKEYLEITH